MDLVKNGDTIIISQNELIINPDEETIEEMKIKQIELENFKLELKKNKGLKTQTTDGREIQVLANISSSADLEESIENNCQGVGLFRTEFFFMDKITPPTEEEQYQIYKSVLEKLNGKEVTIRTIDIGSDKPIEYVDYKEENNPALGKRGVRVYLDYLDLFKTQLKALLRASCHGNLRIMYPMIISVKEVKFIYILSKFFPLFCDSLSSPQISTSLLSFDNHTFRILMLIELLLRAELFRRPVFLICIVLLFCSSQVLNTLCALILQAFASLLPRLFS